MTNLFFVIFRSGDDPDGLHQLQPSHADAPDGPRGPHGAADPRPERDPPGRHPRLGPDDGLGGGCGRRRDSSDGGGGCGTTAGAPVGGDDAGIGSTPVHTPAAADALRKS